jgi:Spy/CpxP family protein refolding chaperone
MGNVKGGLVVLWILIVATTALPGLAQPANPMPGRRGHGGGGDPMQTAIARLNLTGEQQTKVKAISDQETAKIAALREQIRPAHDALDAAAQVEKPDPVTVGKAYLSVKAAEQAVETESAKFHDAVASVLTKDQKVEFEAYLSSAR